MSAEMVPLVFDPTDEMVIVFRLPRELPSGFCFGGGRPVNFQMVDWFNAPASTPRNALAGFIRSKQYAMPGSNLLALLRSGDAFLIQVQP